MELESKDASPAIRLLVRYDFVFAMFFAVGSLFFMFRIESTFNGGLAYAAKVLAVPVALAVFGFTYFNRRYLASLHPGKPWLPWFNSTLIYPLCILFGWPWLMAVNTLTFENHEMEFKGVVTRKFTSGKGHLYEIRIQDISSNEPIELNVSQANL